MLRSARALRTTRRTGTRSSVSPQSAGLSASRPQGAAAVLQLQRTLGNGVTTSLLLQSVGRGNVRVDPFGSPSEREADRVTEEVMRTSPSVGPDKTGNVEVSGERRATNSVTASFGQAGQSLPAATRAKFEPRFGHDFADVRIHTDSHSAETAQALGARAFTFGRHIAFGEKQYAPETHAGQRLIAHELAHVVQQGASRSYRTEHAVPVRQSGQTRIQRSFLDDTWSGIKSVGAAIAETATSAAEWIAERAKDVGGFLESAADWIGGRLQDATRWVVNLIRDLPGRLQRLATTIFEGLAGIVTFMPEAIQALASGGIKGFADWLWEKAKAGGAWVLRLVSRVFDVLGGPELFEFVWHIVTKARPLSGPEIAAASSVLGPDAIRWGDVRVSQGGLLALIFGSNKGRAFVSFHTVNLPPGETIDVVVHELTHVYQFERAGSVYIGQALHAQATLGKKAYEYRGPAGLVADQAAGKHFRQFNREQQAQIAQDYYRYVILGQLKLTPQQQQAYQFFVNELRAGDL